MKFTNDWTREDNNKLRNLIKDGKSPNDIIEYFGFDKISKHPYKKYTSKSKVLTYERYLNEIKINSKITDYSLRMKISTINPNYKDYNTLFNVNGDDYILNFYYMEYNNIPSYELFFTTKEKYNQYQYDIKELQKKTKDGILNNNDFNQISKSVEEQTNKNIPIELMKVLSYVIFNVYEEIIYPKYGQILFCISETDNPIKIKLYRNIIKNSFDNVEESKNRFGENNIYYYKLN